MTRASYPEDLTARTQPLAVAEPSVPAPLSGPGRALPAHPAQPAQPAHPALAQEVPVQRSAALEVVAPRPRDLPDAWIAAVGVGGPPPAPAPPPASVGAPYTRPRRRIIPPGPVGPG
ncbi:hypothetical protein MXD95_007050, partial [Frankia sp. AiPa1]|nr:hypothetical protein [Frankia sp. AiPa1]